MNRFNILIKRFRAVLILAITFFSLSLTHADDTMNPQVTLSTTLGDITLQLDAKNAPISTENFVNYVKTGHFDGLIFHRVIPGFMVQGGGMEPDMKERPNQSPIHNEADNGLKNARGSIAMARTNDPHSASSQFFINLANNDFLNHTSKNGSGWGYAVFGKVIDGGMDVVDEMAKQATGSKNGHQNVPLQEIIINKATIVE